MIRVVIHEKNGVIVGYKTSGHAEYADKGEDIVCAAVSMLTINTANSIEILAGDEFDAKMGDDGRFELMLKDEPSDEATLFLQSMVIGLTGVRDEYGDEFISIETKQI